MMNEKKLETDEFNRISPVDIEKWIDEFSKISPVDISEMNFVPPAKAAIECGISPEKVVDWIMKMSKEEIAATVKEQNGSAA